MASQNETIHTCNMCGKPLDEWDIQENFGFDYYIGYGSKHDMEHVSARFCCDCFDKLLDRLVAECKTSPIVGEYDFIESSERDEALEAILSAIRNYRNMTA